jgi:hypothetical protein
MFIPKTAVSGRDGEDQPPHSPRPEKVMNITIDLFPRRIAVTIGAVLGLAWQARQALQPPM